MINKQIAFIKTY